MPDLDYEKMFKNLQCVTNELVQQQEEYFTLLKRNNELKPYIDVLSEHIITLKMSDQVKLLRLAVRLGELEKTLCEKYGWADEVEETATD